MYMDQNLCALSLYVLSQVILIKPTYVPDFNTKEIIKTEGATISRAKMERGDDGFIRGRFSEGYVSIQYSNALLAPPLKRPASAAMKKPASKKPAAAASTEEPEACEEGGEEESPKAADDIVEPSSEEEEAPGGVMPAAILKAPPLPEGVLKYGKQEQCICS